MSGYITILSCLTKHEDTPCYTNKQESVYIPAVTALLYYTNKLGSLMFMGPCIIFIVE